MALSFFTKWAGLGKVRKFFAGATSGISAAFGKQHIEEYFLKRTKMRFEPRGSNEVAQKAPSGKLWNPVRDSTIRRRKRNRNRAQALFDTGELQGAIQILSTNFDDENARTSFKGAVAKIGVRPSSPAFRYYQIHQLGGRNEDGRQMPARPFLGVGKGDTKAVGTEAIGRIFTGIRRAF